MMSYFMEMNAMPGKGMPYALRLMAQRAFWCGELTGRNRARHSSDLMLDWTTALSSNPCCLASPVLAL